jgi:multidrug efflux system membrane fusion protein
LLGAGQLTVVDNQVDATTGSIRLKAEFANAEHSLWPGEAVMVRLRVEVEKDALTIPDRAVQRGPDGLFVYVVDADNHATTRPITLAHEDADVAVVAKGLNPGEKVVTVGQFGLQPGARVAVVADAGSGS